MRTRLTQDLDFLLPSADGPERRGLIAADAGREPGAPQVVLPPEFNGHDYAVLLLHVAAEIEHSLMVQYLFAAYSMGGPRVPDNLRSDVRRWQEIILGIAKEEMGHLVTVQNMARFLGAPLNLDREDYPWSTPFHPFAFSLRRFRPETLAEYICAESPADWSGPEADEIKALAEAGAGTKVNRVGELYDALTRVLKRKDLVGDDDLRPDSYLYQASWDEWGRGYAAGARGREAGNLPTVQAPELLIYQAYSRASAVDGVTAIGEQGEAPDPVNDEASHFVRFLTIYRDLRLVDPGLQDRLTRRVAENPRTTALPQDESSARAHSRITNEESLCWAHLFNIRYRMLLVNIAHAFRLAGPLSERSAKNARGFLVNRTFAEMYNLRSVSGKLVQLPLEEGGGPDDLRAGPPFEMPYTLDLPQTPRDRWFLQRDLYEASARAIASTKAVTSNQGRKFLVALEQADETALAQVKRILKEPAPPTEVLV